MASEFELRFGCYADRSPASRGLSFRFRWVIIRPPSTTVGLDSLAPGEVDAGDIVPPDSSDNYTLTLAVDGQRKLIQHSILPDAAAHYVLFAVDGRIKILDSKPGVYTVSIITNATSVQYSAASTDNIEQIRDGLAGKINALASSITAVKVSDNSFNLTWLSGAEPAVNVSGPDGCIVVLDPAERSVIRNNQKSSLDIIGQLGDLNPDVIQGKLASKIKNQLLPHMSEHPDILSGLSSALAERLYPIISRHYAGRHTDASLSAEKYKAGQILPERAFASRVASAVKVTFYSDMILPLMKADRYHEWTSERLSRRMSVEIIKQLPPLIEQTASEQAKLKQFVFATASGRHVTVSNSDAGGPATSMKQMLLGELMGVEKIIDATEYQSGADENGDPKFESVSASLTWFRGTTLMGGPKIIDDCFGKGTTNSTRALKALSDDIGAVFAEDGYFVAQDNGLYVFKPTCGNGLVSISVTGVSDHDTQYTSFIIFRMETKDDIPDLTKHLPDSSLRQSPDILVSRYNVDPSLVGAPRAPDQATGKLRQLPQVDWHETILVSAANPTMIVSDDPDTLMRQSVAPRYLKLGLVCYYWIVGRGMAGELSLPIRVGHSKTSPLTLPEDYVGNSFGFPILAVSPAPPPPLDGDLIFVGASADSACIITTKFLNLATPTDTETADAVIKMPNYVELHGINELQFLVFQRIPKVTMSATDASRAHLSDEDDLAYYQFQPWYLNLLSQGWNVASQSTLTGFDPSAAEVMLSSGIRLAGGWDYIGVVIAKRPSKLCYQVPRVDPSDPGYDPSVSARFPVVPTKTMLGVECLSYATPMQLASSDGSLGPPGPGKSRAVRFEYSQPSLTKIVYRSPTTQPRAPVLQ